MAASAGRRTGTTSRMDSRAMSPRSSTRSGWAGRPETGTRTPHGCSRPRPRGPRPWMRRTTPARPSDCRGSPCPWAVRPSRRATFDGARARRDPPSTSPRAKPSASSPGTASTATCAASRGYSANSTPRSHPRCSAAAAAASPTTASTPRRRDGWRPRWTAQTRRRDARRSHA